MNWTKFLTKSLISSALSLFVEYLYIIFDCFKLSSNLSSCVMDLKNKCLFLIRNSKYKGLYHLKIKHILSFHQRHLKWFNFAWMYYEWFFIDPSNIYNFSFLFYSWQFYEKLYMYWLLFQILLVRVKFQEKQINLS